MVDSGAESSLVREADRDILSRTNEFAGLTVVGIGGTVQPLGGGFIDFIFQGYRIRNIDPLLALQWQVIQPRNTSVNALVNGRRPAMGAPLTPQQLADRLNIFGREQLLSMVETVGGVASGHSVAEHKDYSGGLSQKALGRTRAAHPKLNLASWTLRQHIRPGEQWWADIGHMHAPDFRGDKYCRTFSEEHTGVVLQRFCADKTTTTLIKQLEWLERWVGINVPGGALRILRCDFGSEYAVQGRGDDILTAALAAFCAERPDLRVIPCPPHAHAFVKVEGVVHSTAGHSFTNACRANLGELAWSLTERGAMYQHNVRPVWRPVDAAPGPAMSRIEALTGRRPDVSAMLGYVGQHGWLRNFDGKANSHRDNASPCIYISPSLVNDGQLAFNLMTHTIQFVWSISMTDDPTACAALLAESNMHRPRGAYGTPDQDDYTRRLRGLLVPGAIAPLDGHIMVQHDPISGMPTTTYVLVPVIGPGGDLIMSEWPARDFDSVEDESIPALVEMSDDESDDEGVGVPAGPGASALEPDDVRAWAHGAPYYPSAASLPSSMRIWYKQCVKKGASGLRFASYAVATTVGQYRTINAGPYMAADLSWDLKKGIAWIRPGAAASIVAAEAPWDRWRTETAVCAVMSASDSHAQAARGNGAPSQPSQHDALAQELAELRRIADMVALDERPLAGRAAGGSTLDVQREATARELAELHRIEGLDDQPPPQRVPPHQSAFEFAPHFVAATAVARAGVLSDEEQRRIRAYAWDHDDVLNTTFDDTYVISPVSVGTFVDVVEEVLLRCLRHTCKGASGGDGSAVSSTTHSACGHAAA